MADIPTLAGAVRGDSRAALKLRARGLAEQYFGTDCVAVRLSKEAPHIIPGTFQADFEAREHHDLRSKPYGPSQCTKCSKDSWPSDPLPQAGW